MHKKGNAYYGTLKQIKLTVYSHWQILFVIGIMLFIVFAHLWKLEDVPQGLFQDETAIGYNAYLIAETGHDEHGELFPIYFKSFGDYKNSLYIYTASLVVKLLGPSEFSLRFTSFIFFLLLMVGVIQLVQNIWGKQKILMVYTMVGLGFLPWFFTLSRISFEVISQAAVFVFCTLFILKAFKESHGWCGIGYPLLAGFFIGLSLYSYATSRLLSFLFLSMVGVLYFRRSTLKQSLFVLAGFFLSSAPYFLFALFHKGALTKRFSEITYVFNQDLTILERVQTFIANYLQYFSPEFLLFKGDANLRHATGFGGQIYFTVFVLALCGIAWFFSQKNFWKNKSLLLLFGSLLFSPVAAALTNEGTPHALRSVLLGLHLFLFSCIGFGFVLQRFHLKSQLFFPITLLLLLSIESTIYLRDYFVRYGPRSHEYFGSYGIKQALTTAQQLKPSRIVVSQRVNHSIYDFYRLITSENSDTPIVHERVTQEEDTCIVFLYSDEISLAEFSMPYTDLIMDDAVIRLRCYNKEQAH